MSLVKWLMLIWMFTSCGAIPQQKKTCNNCYATTAYEIIKYHHRTLNITVEDLMQQTKQGCAGGSPEAILNKYFSGTKVTRGGLYKVIKLLKKGPLILDYSDQHLVTAWKATSKGILIHDTRDATEKILTPQNHDLKFKYIIYPN